MSDPVELSIDTTEARLAASRINGACRSIADAVLTLASASAALRASWHGPEADAFFAQTVRLVTQLGLCAERGATLGGRLRREIDAWERIACELE